MNHNEKIIRMKENLKELVAYAKPVIVTLEDFDYKRAPFSTANGLRFFMEEVEGLRFTMDTGNFAYSDEDAWEAYQLLKPYVVHVHCKDRGMENKAELALKKNNKGLRAVSVGNGYMPIERVIGDMAENGYDGYYAIEHFNADDQLKCMQDSAAYLRCR